MSGKKKIWEIIQINKLQSNVFVLFILFLIFILSLILYLLPISRGSDVISNIALAIFTSLLATIFAMIAEIFITVKNNARDKFLKDIHMFGIEELNRDKEVYIMDKLKDCRRVFWFSGYRLIMTKNLLPEIERIIRNGAQLRGVICPPWSEGYQLVYEQDKVMDNYFALFHGIDKYRQPDGAYRILFVEKPLFSDTYKIDDQVITGPYMHNLDPQYNRIMAKDFFSYILSEKSELYDIVLSEYDTLTNEAKWELDWNRFDDIYREYMREDYNEAQKKELFMRACVEVDSERMQKVLCE